MANYDIMITAVTKQKALNEKNSEQLLVLCSLPSQVKSLLENETVIPETFTEIKSCKFQKYET